MKKDGEEWEVLNTFKVLQLQVDFAVLLEQTTCDLDRGDQGLVLGFWEVVEHLQEKRLDIKREREKNDAEDGRSEYKLKNTTRTRNI